MANKLDSYSETLEVDGREKEIYFLQFLDENPINLSAIISDEILQILEIYNDDLVFISADEYTGSDLIGIYSFKQGKLVFPFIIREFNTSDESGFIYLQLEEGRLLSENSLNLEINPNNDFAYLNTNGSVFQNEGAIIEKVGKSYYILEDELLGGSQMGANRSYMIYSDLFDTEDSINYRGICNYNYNEEKGEISLEFKDSKDIILNLNK